MGGPEAMSKQEAPLSAEEAAAAKAYAEKVLGPEIVPPTPRDAAREEVLLAMQKNAEEARATEGPTETTVEGAAPATTREEVSADVAAALATIRDHEITPTPQPQIMEMPVQPWQGKDQRVGSGSENKQFPARRRQAERRSSVIDGVATRVESPTSAVENSAPTGPPVESATVMPQAPVEAPTPEVKAEAIPIAAAISPEVVPEIEVPEQKPVATVVPTPEIRQDPAEKKAEVVPSQDQLPPSERLVRAVNNPGITPEAVEAAAITGKPLKVPKPQPAAAEVVVTPPAVTEQVIYRKEAGEEHGTIVPPIEVAPTPSTKGPTLVEKLRTKAEALRGEHMLTNDARAFISKLYTSKPANAIRALGWRVSIEFNDKIATYFEKKAGEHERKKAGFDAAIVNLDKKSGDEAADRARLEAQHGKGIFASRAVGKQLRQELKDRTDSKKRNERNAKFEEGKQKINSKHAEGFEKRKQAAIEKLAVYVEARLAPALGKLEKIQKSKETLHAEVLRLEGVCENIDRAKYEVDAALLESAGKPRSVQMALARKSKDLEKAYGSAQSLLSTRTTECANAEARLVTAVQRVDATRDRLMGIRKKADPAAAEAIAQPQVEEAKPAPVVEAVPPTEPLKHQLEAFGDKSETIPNMTAEEYITSWNELHGSEISLTPARFAERTGIKAGKALSVEVLDAALRKYVLLAVARKQSGEWFSQAKLRKISEQLEPKLAVFRTSLTVKSKV